MKKISPINSEDDIRNDAILNTPKAPDLTKINETPAGRALAKRNYKSSESRGLESISVDGNGDLKYSYRLPMSSYVFAWFYGVVALVAGSLLAPLFGIIKFNNMLYSPLSNPLSIVMFVFIVCVIQVIALLSGRYYLKLVSITISVLIFTALMYVMFSGLISQMNNSSSVTMSSYIINYLSRNIYIMLPVASAIYLTLPKASSAYGK